MEKIYEENKKKKQTFFQQFFNDKGSMVAVIVIAVVAIVGLVTFGFNQITFATDDSTGGFGIGDNSFLASSKGERIYGQSGLSGGNVGFEPFKIDGAGYVICVEFMKEYGWGQTYVQGDDLNDKGLTFLITELNKKLPDSTGDSVQDLLNYWLKQTAVWTYMYEVHDKDLDGLTGDAVGKYERYKLYNKANISSINRLYSDANDNIITANAVGTDGTFWGEYGITAIYDKAVEYGASADPYTIHVESENNKMSVNGDGKYYVTSAYSVGTNKVDNFSLYYVDISAAPEGTLLYNVDGTRVDDGVFNDPSDKFKLMIPIDKVTDDNKVFDL